MMIWKGKELTKYSEIIDTALALDGDEQKRFVAEFAETGPYALPNIGYVSGYYSEEIAKKILTVFDTHHPIFGRSFPSPEEAYRAGRFMAGVHANKAPKCGIGEIGEQPEMGPRNE